MEIRRKLKKSDSIRGWLWAYTIALAYLLVHGMALTVASIILYSHHSSLISFVTLNSLLFYDTTNLIEAIYIVALFVLMFKKRKIAIVHNIIYNALAILFIIVWYFIGAKSLIGTHLLKY